MLDRLRKGGSGELRIFLHPRRRHEGLLAGNSCLEHGSGQAGHFDDWILMQEGRELADVFERASSGSSLVTVQTLASRARCSWRGVEPKL
jgi:hypothetical protein